jgi:hypothetical protein
MNKVLFFSYWEVYPHVMAFLVSIVLGANLVAHDIM